MTKTQTSRKWTRQSYDALYQWTQGPAARKACIARLTRCGLNDVVAELQAADNLGVWHKLTCEAAKAVGAGVVAASAVQAGAELDAIVAD